MHVGLHPVNPVMLCAALQSALARPMGAASITTESSSKDWTCDRPRRFPRMMAMKQLLLEASIQGRWCTLKENTESTAARSL